MKNIKIHSFKLVILLVTILLGKVINAQSWQEEILKSLSLYQSVHYQEKAYIQTDRPVYLTGETIWFSAFLINASTNKLNKAEQVLNVELVSPEGATVVKQLVKLDSGRADGSILINKKLTDGTYFLVAFTNWMRNAGSDYYFSKAVRVISNTQEKIEDTQLDNENSQLELGVDQHKTNVGTADTSLQVAFYPEGGYLLEGINCKVAFEVKDVHGTGLAVSGLLVDGDSTIITAANTIWQGKGMFYVKPEANKEYFVQIHINDSTTVSRKLPKALTSGLALSVADLVKTNQIQLSITRSGNERIDDTAFLLATQNLLAKKALKIDFSQEQSLVILMNKNDFETGIVQFTLFDSQKIPRAERLFLVKDTAEISINVNELILADGPREEVKLELEVRNRAGEPVAGNFAIAVTDPARVPSDFYKHANLYQYINLFADLPGSSFNDKSVLENAGSGNYNAELLMLTYGWRKYTWTEILKEQLSIPKYFVEPGIYVKGQLSGNLIKKRVPSKSVVTMMTDGDNKEYFNMEYFSKEVDKDGAFTFLLQDFSDTIQAVVQTKGRNNNRKNFTIDVVTNYTKRPVDDYSKLISKPKNDELQYNTAVEKVEGSILEKELKRATVEDLFVYSTDYVIEEVVIEETRSANDKEKITASYGAPEISIGSFKIQELAEKNPWNYGLMSILSNAFPELYVDVILGDSGTSSILFQPIRQKKHRFFLFVDGELVGASDVKGRMTTGAGIYTMDDIISIDPLQVQSIDLIFPKGAGVNTRLAGDAEFYQYNVGDQSEDGAATMEGDINDMTAQSDNLVTPVAVLSIYTKDGVGLYGQAKYRGVANINIQGFAVGKEFYRPDYSSADGDSVVLDLSSTLAWIPEIATDVDGKASFSFYSSDESTNYRLEVNGVSADGHLGSLIHQPDKPMYSADKLVITQLEARDKATHRLIQVIDSDSLGLPGVVVKSDTLKWSSFSSMKGFLNINSGLNDETVVSIEKPGYKSVQITVKDLMANQVVLERSPNLETNMSAEMVLQEFYKVIPDRDNRKRNYSDGVYREQIYMGNALHEIIDFSFLQKWPDPLIPLSTLESRIYSGRQYLSNDYTDKITFSSKNTLKSSVPAMDPYNKELSFLKERFARYYDFELMGETYYQGRRVYHLVFKQNKEASWALYDGELFVDAENNELAAAKWKISSVGELYLMPDEYIILKAKDQNAMFIRNSELNEMTYYYDGNHWVPSSAISYLNFSLDDREYKVIREIAWYETPYNSSTFVGLAAAEMNRKARMIKDPKYNPALWRKNFVLPPIPEIEKQMQYLNHVIEYNQ